MSTVLEGPQSHTRDSRPEPLYEKLKPGPGRSASEVRANQRARLHGAMIELVAEGGFPQVTVRGISRLAGVSTRTFYCHFTNTEDCLASTVEGIGRGFLRRATRGYGSRRDGEEDLAVLVRSLMNEFARRPKTTQLLLVDVFDGGDVSRSRVETFTEGLGLLLAECLANAASGVSRQLAVGMAAGIARVATTTTLTDRAAELPELAGALSAWLLSLGSGEVSQVEGVTRSSTDIESVANGTPLGADPEHGGKEPDDLAQREYRRMLATATRLGATKGFENLTVPTIRREAGVSRRSFDARFASPSDCFFVAIETLAHSTAAQALGRASGEEDWERRIHTAMLVLCDQAGENQALAHLVLVRILSPGREGLLFRERLISQAATKLREMAPGDHKPSDLTAEAAAAAAWHIAEMEAAADRAGHLPSLAPLLTSVLSSLRVAAAQPSARG